LTVSRHTMLIPDYEPPQALIVPHGNFTIRDTLEAIAREATEETGVIFLSTDPDGSRSFVDTCTYPERFSIVAAPLDTPWIRDRSPIALRDGAECRWLSPKPHMPERELDTRLFASILTHTCSDLDLVLPQGNLVGGPQGLALSTDRVLDDNKLTSGKELAHLKSLMGIEDWLLLRALENDTIAHADCYARFLGPEILALAQDPANPNLSEVMTSLRREVSSLFPRMKFVNIRVDMSGKMLRSHLNWIQIDKLLLVPLFPETSASTQNLTRKTLEELSFKVVFIPSPTTEFGGALHCLTASVFL
jgi:agmatine/peptidylarginine deiminase